MRTQKIDTEQEAITFLKEREQLGLAGFGVAMGAVPDADQKRLLLRWLRKEADRELSQRLSEAIRVAEPDHPIDTLERLKAKAMLNDEEQTCWGLCCESHVIVRCR